MITLDQLNGAATRAEFAALLDGTYEHSPWIAERAFDRRPFRTVAQLQHAFALVLREAGRDAQLALIRAHPELAGKAMVRRTLTDESAHEQSKAGLTDCSPAEFERLQRLNAAYNEKFGWPFILAVRGPRGTGLTRQQILDAFERRLANPADFEFAESLRNIHRVVELRLADKFGLEPTLGNQAWDCAERLATWSDPPWSERGELTVTYLTDAHRACQRQLLAWMKHCGFDEARIDAVGNVVGVYWGNDEAAAMAARKPSPGQGRDGEGSGSFQPASPVSSRRLLTGSHYDTVRNGGRFDGRLGIFVPLVAVRELHRAGRRLPFGLEVVGFAEEEGQRYKATFLGSSALTGHFDPAWLDQRDADGVAMREAMRAAGLPATLTAIAAEARDPSRYLGFVELHIEQGPVLNALDLPLGIVTSINGGVRYLGTATGTASHAGTTPMTMRRDAACAVAELTLFLERRAAAVPQVVGTVGMLEVPGGSINVVPGRCRFSLDIRATTNQARDACAADVLAEAQRIGERRGVAFGFEETMRAAAAPSDAALQRRWEAAVTSLGLPLHRMPSGAGHDAMKLAEVMPQAMLFVRGENAGISHNPLESSTAHDCELAVRAFQHLLDHFKNDAP
jgi:N-carbamoyl-L-amino-acid hydrolase